MFYNHIKWYEREWPAFPRQITVTWMETRTRINLVKYSDYRLPIMEEIGLRVKGQQHADVVKRTTQQMECLPIPLLLVTNYLHYLWQITVFMVRSRCNLWETGPWSGGLYKDGGPFCTNTTHPPNVIPITTFCVLTVLSVLL